MTKKTSDKEKKLKLTTPKCKALYAWVNTPKTKFKPEGEYTIDVVFDPEDAAWAGLMEQLTEMADEQFNSAYNAASAKDKNRLQKHYPWEERVDANDEPTGMYIMKFKTSAQFTDKKTGEVKQVTMKIFDKEGEPTTDKVMSGSIVRVNFTPVGFTVLNKLVAMSGVTTYLNAVQVVKPGAGSGDASQYGFGSEEEDDDDSQGQTSASGAPGEDDDIAF